MKKLNLKNLKLNDNDLLQRAQLKTIFGGSGNGNGCKAVDKSICTNGCQRFGADQQWHCSTCCIA